MADHRLHPRRGACWIDDGAGTRGKHGILSGATFAFGAINYKSTNSVNGGIFGGPCSDGGSAQGLSVIDPADLARTIRGEIRPNDVPLNPPSYWLMETPYSDMKTPPYFGDYNGNYASQSVTGIAFDPETDRAYVQRSASPGVFIIVDVYQVAR
jgi:hypothetical protein